MEPSTHAGELSNLNARRSTCGRYKRTDSGGCRTRIAVQDYLTHGCPAPAVPRRRPPVRRWPPKAGARPRPPARRVPPRPRAPRVPAPRLAPARSGAILSLWLSRKLLATSRARRVLPIAGGPLAVKHRLACNSSKPIVLRSVLATPTPSRSSGRRWLLLDALRAWRHHCWIFLREPRVLKLGGPVLELYACSWPRHCHGLTSTCSVRTKKTRTQARRRLRSTLPRGPHQVARVEDEYARQGVLQCLAAWDVHRAMVSGQCEPKTGKAARSACRSASLGHRQ